MPNDYLALILPGSGNMTSFNLLGSGDMTSFDHETHTDTDPTLFISKLQYRLRRAK